jgi:lipoyl(octanoyl) transferase
MTVVAGRSSQALWVCHMGEVPYRDALALQLHIHERRLAGELPDVLLLLEHPPVYTRGRRSAPGELALGADFYRARNIEVVQTDRGGRVTYHGPGQLVGYPIMGVEDVGAHLRTIEAAIVAALADEGIHARSRCTEGPDYTGVWVGGGEGVDGDGTGGEITGEKGPARKIASIGVHLSRGVSTHGFAVNVDLDLAPFSWVIACGLPDVTMTSIARELPDGRTIDSDGFRTSMAHHYCATHGRRPRLVSPEQLGLDVAPLGNRLVLDERAQHPPQMRGRTPRASPRRAGTACADATQSTTPGTPLTQVTDHGALV